MNQIEYKEELLASSGLPAIVVTEALPEDSADISRIQKDGWISTYPNEAFGITVEDILTKDFDSPEKIAWRAELIRTQQETKVWVARIDREVVGFSIASAGELQNQLGALYVSSGHRRIGVGRRLMDCALAWLGSEKDVTLEVVPYNENAICFYERYGFHRGSARSASRPSFPNGKCLPEIEMRLLAKVEG